MDKFIVKSNITSNKLQNFETKTGINAYLDMRRVFFKSLIAAASTLDSLPWQNEENCGQRSNHSLSNRPKRVVGGSDALEQEVPWQVELQRFGDFICGGAVVSKHVMYTREEVDLSWLFDAMAKEEDGVEEEDEEEKTMMRSTMRRRKRMRTSSVQFRSTKTN